MGLHHIGNIPAPRGSAATPTPGCGSGACSSCGSGTSFEPAHKPLSAGRMSLASLAVFLLPLALAVAGAAMGTTPAIQTLGAITGLAAGALAARGLTRIIAPRENIDERH